MFSLLQSGAGREACVALASNLDPEGAGRAIERAFMRPVVEVEDDWRGYLADLAATGARPTISRRLDG